MTDGSGNAKDVGSLLRLSGKNFLQAVWLNIKTAVVLSNMIDFFILVTFLVNY
jgi:hypothetical protein